MIDAGADTDIIQKVSNHPVHIIDDKGKLSPSALIPFCEFGGNMSSMGVNIGIFDIPVCNSFQAKILNDQLCYEVDLGKFRNPYNIENELKLGLALFMDYNEDRQVSFAEINGVADVKSFGSRFDGSNDDANAHIYLNTVGKRYCHSFKKGLSLAAIFPEPVKLIGGGKYNLNDIKEIIVTDSYLGLPQDVKKCQNVEEVLDCTTRHHQNMLLKKCGCIPFRIRISKKVFEKVFYYQVSFKGIVKICMMHLIGL